MPPNPPWQKETPLISFTTTTTLTKIIANNADPSVRRDLRDVQRMHHLLTTFACPPDFGPSSRAAANLLYRIEHTSVGVHILMQSTTQPDPKRLGSGYAIAGSRDLTPLLDRLETGTRVRYRIVANPVRSSPQGPGKRGKRHSLCGADAIAWWHRKASSYGLSPNDIQITDSTVIGGDRNKEQQRTRVTIATSRFDGTATVTDPETARHAIITGIGHGRAYGCGLLSIALLQ